MVIFYALGPVAGLIVGGITGWLVTLNHFERIAAKQQEYEEEMAEQRQLDAMHDQIWHTKLERPPEDG